MKTLFGCLLPAIALLLVSSVTGQADQFSEIQNSPDTYWVPAPTPPVYAGGPPPPYYYYGPGYYGPPGPVIYGPRFFLRFHFH